MRFARGAFHYMSAAMVLLSVVTTPVQASTVQDSKASHSVIPPMGSYDPADDIAMAADAVGQSQFADIYGGMALVDQGSHVNIYLTKLDPVAERAIQGAAPADNFTFILTPHTEKQAEEFHQKVTGQATTIESNGIQLAEWGPDVKTGKEEIGVKDLTPDATAYLNSLFGSENIELQNMDYTLMNFDYRSGDSAPRSSGGFIVSESNCCSTGFSADSGFTTDLSPTSICSIYGETTQKDSYLLDFSNLFTMGTLQIPDLLSYDLLAYLAR